MNTAHELMASRVLAHPLAAPGRAIYQTPIPVIGVSGLCKREALPNV
jgi:hypothetical protein